jgi:hypothetical protein
MKSALALLSVVLASTTVGCKESTTAEEAGESAASAPADRGDGTPCALDVAGEKGDRGTRPRSASLDVHAAVEPGGV